MGHESGHEVPRELPHLTPPEAPRRLPPREARYFAGRAEATRDESHGHRASATARGAGPWGVPYLLASGTGSSGPGSIEDIVVLAQDSEVSGEIVASDTTAFWVDRGFSNADSIQAVPLEGGIETTVYAFTGGGVATIPSLALDSDYLYWAESPLAEDEMSLVKRMPLGGGAIEPVLAARGRIQQIVVDPPFLYSVDEGTVRATRLSDRSQTTLGTRPPAGGGTIAADGAATYWLGDSDGSMQAIMAASSPGFRRVRLATRDAVIPAIRVAGPSLYWVERGVSSDGASLFVMDRSGAAPPLRVFESTRMSASASYGHALFAADADGAYWMLEPTGPLGDGALYQGARGVEPRVLVSGIGRPGGVTVSRGWVIFTDLGAGFVVRVSK